MHCSNKNETTEPLIKKKEKTTRQDERDTARAPHRPAKGFTRATSAKELFARICWIVFFFSLPPARAALHWVRIHVFLGEAKSCKTIGVSRRGAADAQTYS